MKVAMYHYVRRATPGVPYLPYLDADDFERQIEYFESTFTIVKREEFLGWVAGAPAPAGVLLTFDDGLRDHFEYALPVLRARGLFGLFYVSSGPILTEKMLDVHKLQLALGKLGGNATQTWLQRNAPELLIRECNVPTVERYIAQSLDSETAAIKLLFNWQLNEEERSEPLNNLFEFAFDGVPPNSRAFYMGEPEIRALTDAGMGVGAHGHRHLVSSRIAPELARQEIDISCNFVESVGGSRAWGYCHPFGSSGALSEYAKKFIADAGCPFALAIAPLESDGPVEIDAPLVRCERYSLPRTDCNVFPYGKASYGVAEEMRQGNQHDQ
jgi:peptidoglycan/xylan/chitin deacetylase (PgdA/CDA1 family)